MAVLGIGGAGCNIVFCIKEKGAVNTQILVLNSDAQQFNVTKADKRILLGYNAANGLGCMGYPERGARGRLKPQA